MLFLNTYNEDKIMKAPSQISNRVPIRNKSQHEDIRELYLDLLERNRLLKELSLRQQIELPLGIADVNH